MLLCVITGCFFLFLFGVKTKMQLLILIPENKPFDKDSELVQDVLAAQGGKSLFVSAVKMCGFKR